MPLGDLLDQRKAQASADIFAAAGAAVEGLEYLFMLINRNTGATVRYGKHRPAPIHSQGNLGEWHAVGGGDYNTTGPVTIAREHRPTGTNDAVVYDEILTATILPHSGAPTGAEDFSSGGTVGGSSSSSADGGEESACAAGNAPEAGDGSCGGLRRGPVPSEVAARRGGGGGTLFCGSLILGAQL